MLKRDIAEENLQPLYELLKLEIFSKTKSKTPTFYLITKQPREEKNMHRTGNAICFPIFYTIDYRRNIFARWKFRFKKRVNLRTDWFWAAALKCELKRMCLQERKINVASEGDVTWKVSLPFVTSQKVSEACMIKQPFLRSSASRQHKGWTFSICEEFSQRWQTQVIKSKSISTYFPSFLSPEVILTVQEKIIKSYKLISHFD